MMELSSVVLPMPLRPSKAIASPWPSRSDIPERTSASPYPAESLSIVRTSAILRAPQIDRLHPSIVGDLVLRPFGEQSTVDEDRDAIRKGGNQVHVVLDQQHARILWESRHGCKDVVALLLGNTGCRLVKQQHTRRMSFAKGKRTSGSTG